MVGVMKAIYAMVDGNVSGAVRGGTEEKASKHAEKLFILIDTDGDGNLTEKEFLRVRGKLDFDWVRFSELALFQGCMQDEELLRKLDRIVADCQPPVAYQTSYY